MPSSIKNIFRKKFDPEHYKNSFLENNTVSLIHGGKEFFTLLKQMIDEASHSIHLQTYIFGDDKTGQSIANALIDAAKRGVVVYLLADGFASQKLSKEFINDLKKAGINFRFFEPLMKSRYFYFGRRLHHKVAVADGIKALVGSMNIADRYNDLPGNKAWFDMALYIEGEVCAVLQSVCWNMWERKRNSLLPQEQATVYPITEKDRVPARVSRNDWVKGKQEVYRTYSAFFRLATENITIVCSYFLPGKIFRRQLIRAAARGVAVRVVLAKTSDIKVVKDAERYLYRWLVRNKINVYEYKPTILHAKMAVVDRHYVTLGSYNLNQLSNYASIELNIDVKDEVFAKKVHQEIDAIIDKDCEAIDLSIYNTRLFSLKQFIQWSSYQFLRFLVMISTFYYRQRE
ncbi:MAG: phospholipase [Chitinophagaceae bacterium]|nr:phospholipase [Chitinophagaceae bacterium]